MYVAIDIGGTNTRVSWSESLDNPSITDNKLEFVNTHFFEEDYSKIILAIEGLSKRVDAIGLGFAGYLSEDKLAVVDANHNREWVGKPISSMLSRKFNCPVYADDDATAAALGIALYGNIGGNFVYITWGTGIGGAIVEQVGNNVTSTLLDWYDYFERWEGKCGGEKIKGRYGKTGDKLTESEWKLVIEDFIEELTIFTKRVKTTLIVFGGGIAIKQKARLVYVQDKLKALGGDFPTLKISPLGEDTGLYGGFGLIKQRRRDEAFFLGE